MQFGSTIGTACLTFLITNIDDAFVLVTFFAESSTSRNLTPLKITLGQFIGFTVIVVVSLIGYAVAVALPSEPIGFLGLLPILLGVWRLFDLILPKKDDAEDEGSESQRIANAKSVFKVAIITVMNGGDNIGTYIPLFSQAQGAEIAVYVVVYYILLGIWCLIAFLIMKQKHILRVAEKYATFIIPFLYLGLGIYIVVKSDCYPWSVKQIDDQFVGNPGKIVMGVVTTFSMLPVIGIMAWFKMRKRTSTRNEEISLAENTPDVSKGGDDGPTDIAKHSDAADAVGTEQPGKGGDKTETGSIEPGGDAEELRSDNEVQPKSATGDSEIQVAK
ncbi:hypothetical protein V494_00530 [Pseudogymnoascus sp. VKM F-4513 (FW-928)]|nr:hypothetical protein V494_00530 [Pseudogymnoascus sp. VKM F-4513 (FW-928)]